MLWPHCYNCDGGRPATREEQGRFFERTHLWYLQLRRYPGREMDEGNCIEAPLIDIDVNQYSVHSKGCTNSELCTLQFMGTVETQTRYKFLYTTVPRESVNGGNTKRYACSRGNFRENSNGSLRRKRKADNLPVYQSRNLPRRCSIRLDNYGRLCFSFSIWAASTSIYQLFT